MKNTLIIALIILSVLSCKKEQVYTDSLGNCINNDSIQNGRRYKIQGTYKLHCLADNWSDDDYYATISITPYLDQYLISPLHLSYGEYSNDKFPISIDVKNIITIPKAKINDYYLTGSGKLVDTIGTKGLNFYVVSTNNQRFCVCNGVKQ